MLEPQFAKIQNPGLMKAARDILGTKGIKELPDDINLRDIQCTIDLASISHYAPYVNEPAETSVALAGLNTATITTLHPAPTAAPTISSSKKETKIVGISLQFEFDAAGSLAYNGNIIGVESYLFNGTVEGLYMGGNSQIVATNYTRYIWTMNQGDDGGYPAYMYSQLRIEKTIPENSRVYIRIVGRQPGVPAVAAAFPANTILYYVASYLQYPQYARI